MHGDWMCLLNEISQFNSVKHTVPLKVGVETHLSWKVVRGQSGGNDNLHLSPILKLTEGDHVSIVCAAEEGFPVMQFSWEHHVVQQKEKENLENNTRARIGREYQDRDSWGSFPQQSGILNNTRKAVYSISSGSHLYSGHQTIDYIANLTHNASILICKTNQRVDDENLSESMYSSSIALTLDIAPIVIISSNTHLHERLGVISGIILAIIFIILIFILLSIFLTRRRKADKKYSSLTDKSSSDELLKPIWVPGKKSRSQIQVGAAKEYVNEFQQFGEGRELSDCVPPSKRGRGREVVQTQDTNLRHCRSHEQHDTCQLESMVYVKQSQNKASAKNKSPEYQNVPHVRPSSRRGHVVPVDTFNGNGIHVCKDETCLGIPENVLDISVETHSEQSSTEHSRNMSINAASVSRPTTRTTKTISDGSDSSRSSVLLDKSRPGTLDRRSDQESDHVESFLRGASDNVESYISFQSDIRDHSDAIYSPNSTINSDKISGIVTDPEYQELTRRGSLQHHHCHPRDRLSHTAQSLTDDSVSLLHETHFGDSLTDIPRTVIRAIPHCEKISPDDLERIAKRYSLVKLRNTIFDCEQGCFLTFEEFEKRISQESLNKIKE